MDCRTAHTFLIDEHELEADEQQAYQAHITQCAACRDDHHDPLSRALVQTTRELALPPPNFTAQLMQRLPNESPLELAQQAARRQRHRTALVSAGFVGLTGFALVAGYVAQPVWAGTTLGLVAQVVTAVSVAAIQPIVVMLASALVIALLLPQIIRHPTASRSLGAAAIAAVLVVSAGAVTAINDQENARAAATNTSVATVFRSLQIDQPLNGAAASLAGDIAIAGDVRGDVASLVGDVSISPSGQIGGNVLAGRLQAAPNQVAGAIHHNLGALAVSDALRTSGTASLSPSLVRGLGALLGALVTLALAGLVVMLWPDRTLRTSRLLPHQPWSALGLGVLITALLLLLALPVLALLAATVVGMLLAPVLLVAVHLPYVQGLAAVGQALGQRLTGVPTLSSALWGVSVQLVLVLGLGMFAPFAGLAAFYLLASLGIGAQVLDRRSLI